MTKIKIDTMISIAGITATIKRISANKLTHRMAYDVKVDRNVPHKVLRSEEGKTYLFSRRVFITPDSNGNEPILRVKKWKEWLVRS